MKPPKICLTQHANGTWYIMMSNEKGDLHHAYPIEEPSGITDDFNFALYAKDKYKNTLDLAPLLRRVVKDK